MLSTQRGQDLLRSLEGFDEEHAAAAAAAARRSADADVSAAALSTVFARHRARASKKFPDADAMLFTRSGYEQATSHAVALHKSERFNGMREVADLCCGIGSDGIAIAGRAGRVVACDIDIDALACAIHNAEAAAVGARMSIVRCDALALPLDDVDAAYADPSRRSGAARARSSAAYSPPLDLLLDRAREIAAGRLAVKTAPGLDFETAGIRERLRGLALEVEVVSERGVCKEAMLWCGAFARADGARRATAIDAAGAHVLDGSGLTVSAAGAVAAFVGEPDPAVIRAGLVGEACALVGAAPVDARVAYLTTDRPTPGAFVRWFAVRDVMGFGVHRIRAYLREHGIGELVVKTRAFPLAPQEIVALLKPKGGGRAVLICATLNGKKTAIVCDAVTGPIAQPGRTSVTSGKNTAT
jgi:SAM-dependent methyltransferase